MNDLKIVVARNDDSVFNSYLKPSLDILKTNEHVKIAEIFNEPNDSIFKKYNRGIDLLDFSSDDVFCFIHEDVKIHDKYFFEKIKFVFESKENIGVLGLIGTKSFPTAGGWWLTDYSNHVGHLIQGLPDGSTFHMDRGTRFDDSMSSVDGFCFFVSGEFLKQFRFDDISYPGAYHFYDVDTCFSALAAGYKVAVADILLEHKSEGPMPESWHKTKDIFLTKWAGKNIKFPVVVGSISNK